jgi:hypothetical protein
MVFSGMSGPREATMETDFLRSMACDTHVSLLHALSEGLPEGTCIRVGYDSVMALVVAFAVNVMLLQWVVRRVIAAARSAKRPAAVQGPVWSARADSDGGPIR